MHTDAVTLHPDDELAERREGAAGQPVIIAHNGVRYRTEREDPFAFSDPAKMRAAIRAGAGAFKGIDVDQFLAAIREARGHGPETDAEHRALYPPDRPGSRAREETHRVRAGIALRAG